MRAAGWLRPRDLPAARAQWLSARHLAVRLPDDHDDVIGMRIAPRTMLISTESYVGIDPDGDEQYSELGELTMQANDMRSLAIAAAGRIISFTFNEVRVPEAAALAAQAEDMLCGLDWDAVPEIDIILIAVLRAYYAKCDFDAALRVSDAILARPPREMTIEYAGNFTFRGVIEMCLGNHESGRRNFRKGMALSRILPPVSYAIIQSFSGRMVAMGMYEPDDLVDEMREVLRRAESFGDICGIIDAQYSYGTVLLRAREASRDEAIEVLAHARASIEKHSIQTNTMTVIGADLAMDAARKGRRHDAIDDLRALLALHLNGGIRVEIGCAGEALVRLLIDRGGADDFTEAHRIVDEWQVRRPDIPAADLWWLKSRALLAEAEGDSDKYAELSKEYLGLCEKLDANGLLAEARQMVAMGRMT